MPKFRFRPRKWLAQLSADLQRRMQAVLFASYFGAEVLASQIFFRIAPLNPICVWYPNVWAYGIGHLISALLVVLVVAGAWWFVGNLAFWESICHTRQRPKVLLQGGVAGLAIDLAASLLDSYVGSHPLSQGDVVPWLLLRAGLWSVAYAAAGGALLWILHLDLRSRRLTGER